MVDGNLSKFNRLRTVPLSAAEGRDQLSVPARISPRRVGSTVCRVSGGTESGDRPRAMRPQPVRMRDRFEEYQERLSAGAATPAEQSIAASGLRELVVRLHEGEQEMEVLRDRLPRIFGPAYRES